MFGRKSYVFGVEMIILKKMHFLQNILGGPKEKIAFLYIAMASWHFFLTRDQLNANKCMIERSGCTHQVSRCPWGWEKTERWWGWAGQRRGWRQHCMSSPSGSGSRQGEEKDQDSGCPPHQEFGMKIRPRTGKVNYGPSCHSQDTGWGPWVHWLHPPHHIPCYFVVLFWKWI